MNELELIERIRRQAESVPGNGVALGIGDDCAVFRPRAGRDLLLTTDMVIEDVHFRAATHPAEAVGHRALARGLSDIAAMGGEPRLALISLALAPWSDRKWVDGFYRGFLRLARRTGTALAGGDLTRSGKVSCDVVVVGEAPRGKALRRDGARVGDAIYVSGRLGASALGLERGEGAAWKIHLRPEPRLALGRYVREKLRATAAMDLSDGLSIDLYRLCRASGVAAVLDGKLPVYRGASVEQALHGGEDYELLFTVRESVKVPAKIEGLAVTRVGTLVKGKPGVVRFAGEDLVVRGWDPFR
jgi:thiamine-monophosphate kinase